MEKQNLLGVFIYKCRVEVNYNNFQKLHFILRIRYFPAVYRHCCMAYKRNFYHKKQGFRKMEISEELR
jgi:hypothetical protein